jgi:hypothetical protein
MLPIVYGYPGIETREAEQRGEIVLGGCTVDYGMPAFSCKRCGATGSAPLLRQHKH